MTPKKACLVKYGVFREDVSPVSKLMAKENINQDKLRQFARVVASHFGIPATCDFVKEVGCGKERLHWIPSSVLDCSLLLGRRWLHAV